MRAAPLQGYTAEAALGRFCLPEASVRRSGRQLSILRRRHSQQRDPLQALLGDRERSVLPRASPAVALARQLRELGGLRFRSRGAARFPTRGSVVDRSRTPSVDRLLRDPGRAVRLPPFRQEEKPRRALAPAIPYGARGDSDPEPSK